MFQNQAWVAKVYSSLGGANSCHLSEEGQVVQRLPKKTFWCQTPLLSNKMTGWPFALTCGRLSSADERKTGLLRPLEYSSRA